MKISDIERENLIARYGIDAYNAAVKTCEIVNTNNFGYLKAVLEHFE